MNTGIQDAVALAWRPALAVEGVAAEGLLDSYDAAHERARGRLAVMPVLAAGSDTGVVSSTP
jgi:2-polyprenyl-6-methoxyphenol hydroxylase-like FAD-dependent oxidoreductase